VLGKLYFFGNYITLQNNVANCNVTILFSQVTLLLRLSEISNLFITNVTNHLNCKISILIIVIMSYN